MGDALGSRAEEWLEEAVLHATHPMHFEWLAQLAALHGLWERAWQLVASIDTEQGLDSRKWARAQLARLIMERQGEAAAEPVLETFTAPERDLAALLRVRDLGRAGRADDARRWVERVVDPGRRDDVRGVLVEALGDGGHFDAALAEAGAIGEVQRREQSVSNVARSLALAGLGDQAMALRDRLTTDHHRDGIQKMLLAVFEQQRDLDRLERVTRTLEGTGSWNAACGAVGRAAVALHGSQAGQPWLDRMRLPDKAYDRGLLLGAMAAARSVTGDPAGALAMVTGERGMARSCGLDNLMWGTAMAGRWDEARAALAEMARGDVNQATAQLAGALARAGRDSEAVELAASIRLAEMRRMAADEIVEAQIGRGDTAGVEQTVATLWSPAHRAIGLILIAELFARQGDVDSAVRTAKRCKSRRDRAGAYQVILEVTAGRDPRAPRR